MTTREFYVAIAEAQVSDELTTKAQELIAAGADRIGASNGIALLG